MLYNNTLSFQVLQESQIFFLNLQFKLQYFKIHQNNRVKVKINEVTYDQGKKTAQSVQGKKYEEYRCQKFKIQSGQFGLKCSPIQMMHSHKNLKKYEIIQLYKLQNYIILRSYHYPIQYICKQWPFGQLNLLMKYPILIPRFQTEYMMSILYEKIQRKYQYPQRLKFVEYGCGSGAIGISLHRRYQIPGIMIDINKKCINLTKKNARLNDCDAQELKILESLMEQEMDLMQEADIIVSNPPYLSQKHYKKCLHHQVKKFESKEALVGGEDGMKYIDILVENWFKKKGNGILMIEYDGRVFKQQRDNLNKHVLKDQYGKNRYLYFEK